MCLTHFPEPVESDCSQHDPPEGGDGVGGTGATAVPAAMPAVGYIAAETPFALMRPLHLVIGPDEPFEASVRTVTQEFLQRTREYVEQALALLKSCLAWCRSSSGAAVWGVVR